MLVCRRFTSSTRKTPTHLLLDLKKLLGAADVDVTAADAASALADAVGEAARAVVAAAGDVTAGSRRGAKALLVFG
jgi:mRNA-degrading endonuclease toxin of MazEF toxin-antitoxin module